jgi:uncharacterized membrane protein
MKREIFPIQLRNYRPLSHNRGNTHFSDRLAELLSRWLTQIGERTFSFIRSHWLGIINFLLGLFIVGALVAPYLRYLDRYTLSKTMYGFYGLFCHQMESRSFLLRNYPVAICVRCFSFYSSCLVFGIWMSLKRFKPISLTSMFILLAPGCVDGWLQIVHIKESSNLLRTTTGILMGLALVGYLIPRAQEGMRLLIRENAQL